MEKLSDDVLLMVMEYLHVEDILACRLTCKKLAGVALHPAVWRHQSFTPISSFGESDESTCPCPLLRIAPCLESLKIKTRWHISDLFFTTRCSVEKLILDVNIPMHSIQTICNQEALGRLRHLELHIDADCDPSDASVFLERLVNVSGLEKLEVTGTLDFLEYMPRPQTTYIEASLKHLSWTAYTYASREEPTCNTVLATHAATLETVDLEFITQCKKLSTTTASLLARMPKLRVLCCYPLPGLEAVAACESLTEVTLIMSSESGMNEEPAVELLRLATQLRKVELQCSEDGVGEHLLLSLASSGRSAVESLIYRHFDERYALPEEPLLRALPSLPALRHLELELWLEQDEVPDELLLGFTPATAPALQTLRLTVVHTCLHTLLHSGSFKEFLVVNPSLQVFMNPRKVCTTSSLPCETCLLDCKNYLLGTSGCIGSDEKVDWLSMVIDHENSTH